MLGFTSIAFELAVTLSMYLATASLVIAWVALSNQTLVRYNRATVQRIVIRLGVIFTLLFALCFVGGFATWLPVVALALMALLGSLGEFIVGAPAFGFLYVVQQYLLGFPDRKEWVLTPDPEPTQESNVAENHIGKTGIAVSPLKPSGVVSVDNRKHQAMSEGSRFLETGQTVIVKGHRNGMLVVCASNDGQSLRD